MADNKSKAIRIMCPNLRCRAVLSVPGQARGKTVRCNNCGTNIRIPKPNEAAAAPKAQAAPPPMDSAA